MLPVGQLTDYDTFLPNQIYMVALHVKECHAGYDTVMAVDMEVSKIELVEDKMVAEDKTIAEGRIDTAEVETAVVDTVVFDTAVGIAVGIAVVDTVEIDTA
jgi:hypothetical protein